MTPSPAFGAASGTARAIVRLWPLVLVLAGGLSVTMYLWRTLQEINDARGAEHFRSRSHQLAEHVEARMRVYAALLAAGTGLFDAAGEVSEAQWKSFVAALDVGQNYPGIQGYGYAARVSSGERARFEAQRRASRGAPFAIWPAEARDEHLAVVYLEPRDERNRRVIGFDMYSNPERAETMRRAAVSGSEQLSGPVRLLNLQGEGREQSAILMFRPVYRGGTQPATEAERLAALRGFVYAPFRIDDLLNALIADAPPDFDFTLLDRARLGGTDVALFRHVARGSAKAASGGVPLEVLHAIPIGGRLWAVAARAPRGYGVEGRSIQESAVLAGGVLLTVMLAFLAYALLRTGSRAQALADRMTADLKESRLRFERMVAGSSDGVWEYDLASHQCYLAPRFMELLGFPATEAREKGEWIPARLHDDDRAGVAQAFKAMLRAGEVFDRRLRMRRFDDSYRWFRVRGRIFDEAGRVTAAGSISDIHEEQEARFGEARLLKVIDRSPDIFMTFDLEGRPTYLNPAARRVFGDPGTDSLAGFSIAGMFSQNEVDRVFNEGVPTAYLQEYWESETELITAAGEVLPVSQVILSHKSEAGPVEFYSTVMRDISERRAAMDALKQARERLQRALDGSNDVVWEVDIVQDRMYVSERLAALLGYPQGMEVRTRAAWEALVHADDLAIHQAAVARMRASGVPVVWDTRMRLADGRHRWMRLRGRAVLGADGAPMMTAGTMTDIHDARLAEEELMDHRDNLARLVEERTAGLEAARCESEAQRVRAEASREAAERANLAKSEFLANMSHELRTPMHAIISFANFGAEKHARAERDKLAHYFRNIQKSGSRLLALLNDLLDLSKLEAGKMRMDLAPADIGALLGEAAAEAEAFSQSRGVRLNVEVDGAVRDARWDGPRVLQVLRNLISNAVKFSLPGGLVSIRALAAQMPAGRRAGDPGVPGVEIRVSDAGIGIPAEELEAVFDKFVQSSKTKTGAGGTGLGLAICREIVIAHHGRIHAENNPSPAAGATIVVRLPLDAGAARPLPGAPAAGAVLEAA